MAFLAPLLSAGMSSGILPNIIKGVGGFVSDVIGGLGTGRPLLETIGGAAKRGLTTALGGASDEAAGEPSSPMRAVVQGSMQAANARPVIVPASAGLSRVVRTRGPMQFYREPGPGSRRERRRERRDRKYRDYYRR